MLGNRERLAFYWKARRFIERRLHGQWLRRREAGKRRNLRDYRASLARRDEIVKNTPLEIFLEMSNRCNINCKMCALHNVKGGGTMMSWETINRVVPLLDGAHRLHAHGFGEPTLNKHMWDLLRLAKEKRLYVDFFTNGMMLHPERAEWLVEIGVDELTVSFDGATKETFEWVREGASFDLVAGHIRHLNTIKKQRGTRWPIIKVNFVAMTRNFGEIAELVELCASWGVEEIEVKPMVVYDFLPEMHRYRKSIESGSDEELLGRARSLAASHGITVNVYLPRSRMAGEGKPGNGRSADSVAGGPGQRGNASSGFCWYPFRTLYIRADGNVKPCCYYWDEDYPGSLKASSVLQVWQGEGFRRLREQWRRGEVPPGCRHCEEFKLRPAYDDTDGILARLHHLW